MAAESVRFPETIRARAPRELREAVERVADRDLTTTSAYARKALLNQLKTDGIELTQVAAA
jgi:hypothetical protein